MNLEALEARDWKELQEAAQSDLFAHSDLFENENVLVCTIHDMTTEPLYVASMTEDCMMHLI